MSQTTPRSADTITDMIREDHAQVMGTFHDYRADAPPEAKQKLVNTVGEALETQARLKEEILYPALRAAEADEAVLNKGLSADHEIHSLVGQLRDMKPTATRYDDTVMTLQGLVTQQVADEEALLLQAEQLLQDQLRKLGVRMRTRRLVINRPSLRQMAIALAATGGVVAGALLIRRALSRRV
jgi:hypothetical protein